MIPAPVLESSMSLSSPLSSLYAQTPARRGLQVAGDVLLVVWVWAWVSAGIAVHRATLALAEPGLRLEAGAGDVAGSLTEAGRTAGELPLVGERLATPFLSAGDAATAVADAGRRQAEVATDLALLLGVVVAAVPVLLALLLWVPGRVRFARRSAAVRRLVSSDADLRLFALRALTTQPLHRLARVSQDPVGAWDAGEPSTVRALAALELADAGMRLPLEGSRA